MIEQIYVICYHKTNRYQQVWTMADFTKEWWNPHHPTDYFYKKAMASKSYKNLTAEELDEIETRSQQYIDYRRLMPGKFMTIVCYLTKQVDTSLSYRDQLLECEQIIAYLSAWINFAEKVLPVGEYMPWCNTDFPMSYHIAVAKLAIEYNASHLNSMQPRAKCINLSTGQVSRLYAGKLVPK